MFIIHVSQLLSLLMVGAVPSYTHKLQYVNIYIYRHAEQTQNSNISPSVENFGNPASPAPRQRLTGADDRSVLYKLPKNWAAFEDHMFLHDSLL